MSKKQKQAGLGKALKNKLQKKRFVGMGDKAPIFFQQTEENEADKKKQKMQSVLEQNSLAEYLQVAQMSQQDFHANRNIKFSEIREEMNNKKIIVLDQHKNMEIMKEEPSENVLAGLQVPRRPLWKEIKSKDDLEKCQNDAYLNWRRKLAEVEEKHDDISITPYEKNLEVWRQLWRVVERCSVLVQIIDGRNPLFFLSDDLFTYAREVGKEKFLLVINKSDLVPAQVRELWNQYFKKNGIDHCFFTAKEGLIVEGEEKIEKNTCTVLSPHQLVDLLQQYSEDKQIEIGLTGYPNVGKSSVINALLGRKKVGVASMPGKTKHFQTLKLTEKVTLCDCPGLVFPKVHASKAEMVLNGLYPIDTLKEFEQPLELIALRIPRQTMEETYYIQWKDNEPYDGESILVKYARLRGYFGGNGQPVQSKASRYILKDYVNGVIVYCHRPPMGQKKQATFKERQQQLQFQKQKFQKEQEKAQQNLDDQFFDKQQKMQKTVQEVIDNLTEDDLLDIIQGKKVEGMRITKQIRKEIKFALKRGDKIEQVRKMLLELGGETGHKKLIKV